MDQVPDPEPGTRQPLDLFQAAQLLLGESRTVLPGIQGLFGFQLVVVFSPRFQEALSHSERVLHLVAIALIALAIALIMSPAATHRQGNGLDVTLRFLRLSTRLMLASMVPLALGLSIDFYLVARVITDSTVAALFAAVLLAVFALLWFVAPRAWDRGGA